MGTNLSNQTWEYSGFWSLRSQTLPQLQSPGLTFDSQRGVSVLFGGTSTGGDTSNTYEWNGIFWVQRSSNVWPSTRSSPGITFDSARGVTVLFGGTGFPPRGDTWEWDGTNWVQRSNTGPSARYGCGLAYDEARKLTTLFGGIDTVSSQPLGDTWVWDGDAWTALAVAGPTARAYFGMAYDGDNERVYLFGGRDATGTKLNDFWYWDGAAWAQSADVGPTARDQTGMAYDGLQRELVVFGGNTASGQVGDTWKYRSTQPSVTRPGSWAICDGENIALPVVATGSGNFNYQWYKDGVRLTDGPAGSRSIITGANGSELRIENAYAGNAGNYNVLVTDSGLGCSVASDSAFLTAKLQLPFIEEFDTYTPAQWVPWPPITTVGPPPPTSPLVMDLYLSGSAETLPIDAAGYSGATLHYQWARKQTQAGEVLQVYYTDRYSAMVLLDIISAGPTTPTYHVREVPLPAAAMNCGLQIRFATTATSDNARWFIDDIQIGCSAPGISTQPQGGSVEMGGQFSFTVGSSAPNLTFQWRKNGVNLSDGPTGAGSTISGSASPTLTIGEAQAADAAAYTVLIINGCGSVTSSAANLTVRPACTGDLNFDEQVDLGDLGVLLAHYGLNDATAAEGDLNGDHIVDLSDLAIMLSAYGAPCP